MSLPFFTAAGANRAYENYAKSTYRFRLDELLSGPQRWRPDTTVVKLAKDKVLNYTKATRDKFAEQAVAIVKKVHPNAYNVSVKADSNMIEVTVTYSTLPDSVREELVELANKTFATKQSKTALLTSPNNKLREFATEHFKEQKVSGEQ